MDFVYEKALQFGSDSTQYEKISSEGITVTEFSGKQIVQIEPEVLTELSRKAFEEIGFKLRTAHLEQVADILQDPEASDNDRFVAKNLLQNSVIAATTELPTCQDTGTAIVFAKKGQQIWVDGDDAEYLSRGAFEAYSENYLRYSQVAPLSMYEEKNTGSNLPAQVDLLAETGDHYKFLFVAKGGGSANKTYFYPMTKALLNPTSLEKFIKEKIRSIGTAACPPYHLAFVIGGTSAEMTMKLVKLASCGYLDQLPISGSEGGRYFRDLELEKQVKQWCIETGIGAQFGGKYFVHDVRIIRGPRHAASCPVGLGVSCSADRNIKAYISSEGVFLEKLEEDPARFLPSEDAVQLSPPVEINLDQPMDDIRKTLSQFPVTTRLSLTGTMIVARDIAHAKLAEMLDQGEDLPQYFKDHPVYYAGPAKTPPGFATGSFGPTTAGRMDGYVDRFQAAGGSLVMVAKGNRAQEVTDACAKHGGFYLGSIGGPAAILAKENILSSEVLAFPELGMEAIRKITVKNFPAFIIVDDKGNDFFANLT